MWASLLLNSTGRANAGRVDLLDIFLEIPHMGANPAIRSGTSNIAATDG